MSSKELSHDWRTKVLPEPYEMVIHHTALQLRIYIHRTIDDLNMIQRFVFQDCVDIQILS